jgi:CheY-like chemotaxis protein
VHTVIPLAEACQFGYIVYVFAKNRINTDVSQPYDFSGLRILLVDDVETNRMVVKLFLANTNIDIHEACDGETALNMFAESPEGYFNAVFMDIQMPGIDGFETTRRIRGLPRHDARKAPIIAMTGVAYKDMEESGLAEMNGYIAKPVDSNEIKKLLNNLLTTSD